MNNASDSKKIIKNSGLKVTEKRLKILNFLQLQSKPLTAEEISYNLKINIVTCYRILESFSVAGLIYQTDFRQGKAFFEFQEKGHHHHHITCTKCGNREHINFCFEKDFKKQIKKSNHFNKIDSHMLEFFGVCKKCEKK